LGPLCRGWILGRRVLSICCGISLAARWPFSRDFGGPARHCVGFRSLLCRHHGSKLVIPLYPPNRFFNRDYSVFDCGGMAFGKANLKPFVRVCPACLLNSARPITHRGGLNARSTYGARYFCQAASLWPLPRSAARQFCRVLRRRARLCSGREAPAPGDAPPGAGPT
jgi:hypothetical protein